MTANNAYDAQIRKYLLGELSESAMEVVEQNFENPAIFTRVEVVEDELMSDYIDENLSAEERSRFERLFLTTESRREKFLFVQALRQRARLQAAPVPRKTVLERLSDAVGSLFETRLPSLATRAILFASLIFNAGLGWLAMDWARQLAELEGENVAFQERENELTDRLDAADARVSEREEQLQSELRETTRLRTIVQNLQNRFSRLRVPFTLQTQLLRSAGEIPRLSLPSQAVVDVRLPLEIESENYRQYRVALRGVDGNASVERGGLAPRRESDRHWLDFSLLAEQLPPGDYRIQLYGVDEAGAEDELNHYVFRVEREKQR